MLPSLRLADLPPPTRPPGTRPPGRLPLLSYALLVVVLSILLGSVAQSAFLPLGIWWTQLFVLFLPTWILLRSAGRRPLRFLRFDRLPPPRERLLVAATAPLLFLSASALMEACEQIVPSQWAARFDLSRLLARYHGPWQAVLLASVVAGAPLAEETVFRGYLLPALRERGGRGRANWVQALLFALVHFDPIGFPPRLLLGLAFGELVEWTGSIWASVFAHALNNGLSAALFLAYGPGPEAEAAPADARGALLLSAVAGAGVLVLLHWLRRRAGTPPRFAEDDGSTRAAVPSPASAYRQLAAWAIAVTVTLALLGLFGPRAI